MTIATPDPESFCSFSTCDEQQQDNPIYSWSTCEPGSPGPDVICGVAQEGEAQNQQELDALVGPFYAGVDLVYELGKGICTFQWPLDLEGAAIAFAPFFASGFACCASRTSPIPIRRTRTGTASATRVR